MFKINFRCFPNISTIAHVIDSVLTWHNRDEDVDDSDTNISILCTLNAIFITKFKYKELEMRLLLFYFPICRFFFGRVI